MKYFSGIKKNLEGWEFNWIPFTIYTLFIIKTAMLRHDELPGVFDQIPDKVLHAVQYFFLFFFTWNAFMSTKNRRVHQHATTYAIIFCMFMGAFTEILQAFIPWRQSEFLDWVADTLGASIGLIVFYLFFRLVAWLKQTKKTRGAKILKMPAALRSSARYATVQNRKGNF